MLYSKGRLDVLIHIFCGCKLFARIDNFSISLLICVNKTDVVWISILSRLPLFYALFS